VYAVSPVATRGLAKVGGRLIPAAPGTEPEVLEALGNKADESKTVKEAADALRAEGAIILVGERLATVPGALSAAAKLAADTGARLAWVPRRAGERGALEAGALPSMLPGGRLVADSAARSEVAAAWQVAGLPETPGLDTAGIIAGARDGSLDALVIGGVDPADLGLADAADATAHADVILPVAAQAEKAGTFVNWEGRVRPFEQALSTNAVSDYRALDMLADAMGEFFGARTVAEVRAEMTRLGAGTSTRPSAPTVAAEPVRAVARGDPPLATWRHLLDKGSMQDGEPFLAGTATKATARVSGATAEQLGLVDGELVTVRLATGDSVTVPLAVTEMADHVLWLPTNSAGCDLRSALAAPGGDHVTVTKGGQR
jgi:NADH-quinone oxidoreductase subunit G